MTWEEKLEHAKKVATMLDTIGGEGKDREQDLGDIMEITTKLLLPGYSVQLIGKSRNYI